MKPNKQKPADNPYNGTADEEDIRIWAEKLPHECVNAWESKRHQEMKTNAPDSRDSNTK